MLVIKNITKSYGRIVALSEISLEVKNGEFVFLTGPSGSGKTTLLRLIIGEISPDSGQILLDGKDVTKLSSKELPYVRQQIGVVFQDYKILSEKTVRENIEIALAVIGLSPDKWSGRVENVLKLTSLEERANQFPSQLSGGELQRVSLARALVVDPKVILADEPTGNLDWDTADRIMDILVKVNKEGKTVIVASHHKDIMKRIDKRMIKLNKGKIEK